MSIKDSYLGQAWLVLALSLCFGAALAGVQLGLNARIEENKRKETLDRVPDVVPNAVQAGERLDVAGYVVYPVYDKEGRHAGWMVKAAGLGYADRIELLVGLDHDAERITGMWVLDQKETPNLGNRIEEEGFRRQFFGGELSSEYPIRVTKSKPQPGANQIRAISGATVSSDSVCGIINRALAKVRADLAARAAKMDRAAEAGSRPARPTGHAPNPELDTEAP